MTPNPFCFELNAALILIYEEVEKMGKTGSWANKLSAFIANLPYFSFVDIYNRQQRATLRTSRVSMHGGGNGGQTTEAEEAEADTWLHVLVEQGNNTVMWKVPRDRVVESFDELKYNLLGEYTCNVECMQSSTHFHATALVRPCKHGQSDH